MDFRTSILLKWNSVADRRCKEPLQNDGEAKNSSEYRKLTTRNEGRAMWILSGLTVALCIVLITLTLTWQHHRRQTVTPKHEKVCFDCTAEEDSHYLRDFRKPESNDTQCCGYLEDILNALVSKVMQQRYNSEVIPRGYTLEQKCEDSLTQETPAANLIDIHKNTFEAVTSDAFLVVMKKDAPSFMHSGLKYEHGNCEINKGGFYYIYSQLRMKINLTNEEGPLFRHYVYRHSHEMNTVVLLLENTETPCKSEEPSLEMTSSVGAVFKLDKSDKIYVATTHPQYLHAGHSNVFSIRLIST